MKNLLIKVKNFVMDRSFLLLCTDIAIIALSYGLSLFICALRREMGSPAYVYVLWTVLPVVFYLLFSRILKIDRIIWRYASGSDFLRILLTAAEAAFAAFLACELIGMSKNLPTLYSIMSAAVCALGITASRLTYFAIIAHRSARRKDVPLKKLLIVGAGSAGSMMLTELLHNPSLGLLPVAVVDDDRQKLHRRISGIKVYGNTREIPAICREHGVDLIYIAIPSATNAQRARILEYCAGANCPVKILPFFSETDALGSLAEKVRNITPEELLGREPVKVADEALLSFVSGKTVAITGGGGSIGSEICRQVAANSPGKLVIIDIYENNAYAIQQELIGLYGDRLNLSVHIASVRDAKKMDLLFAREKPDIVVHAAAHKHVPLMEDSPDEAVKNNVFGLFNTAAAADKNGVKKFILISTDKAVNPTNVMGATKRICEMLITYFSGFSKTTFTAVRFGNVLGSNGSVIPLFKSQIEARHDVTVTHPEMIRYFMTIPEASQLVLASGAMAKSGEIFVLDMGQPVRIDDLAKKMISLSGLVLGRDINIRYTGLRPGEKMYEELLMSEEGLTRTENRKIFIGHQVSVCPEEFSRQLAELNRLCTDSEPDHAAIRKMISLIVPTYRPAQL